MFLDGVKCKINFSSTDEIIQNLQNSQSKVHYLFSSFWDWTSKILLFVNLMNIDDGERGKIVYYTYKEGTGLHFTKKQLKNVNTYIYFTQFRHHQKNTDLYYPDNTLIWGISLKVLHILLSVICFNLSE